MSVNRRSFLSFSGASVGFGAGGGLGLAANSNTAMAMATGGGSLDATQYGISPGGSRDQTKQLQRAINDAAQIGMPLFLPPGRYLMSGVTLPDNAMLLGIPGQSRLIFAGGSHMFYAKGARGITLNGLSIGSAGNAMTERASALIHLKRVRDFSIENCIILRGNKSGIALDGASGRITGCEISAMDDSAIYSLDAKGLEISRNVIHNCKNNGILIWQSKQGEDGTQVFNNRISQIGAIQGGTGQNGNGVNIFRAGDVSVANNRITDCAFSAIRCNGGANVQMVNNSCSRIGEISLYAEFAFNGAIISNNTVDDAAAGISITNSEHGGHLATCNGNLVRNLHRKPPYYDGNNWTEFGIYAEADTAISGNLVEDTAGTAFLLGWGKNLRNVVATGNVVRNADVGFGISVVKGTEAAVVTSNTMTKIRKKGITGMEWRKIVSADLSRDNQNPYSQLTLSNNLLT